MPSLRRIAKRFLSRPIAAGEEFPGLAALPGRLRLLEFPHPVDDIAGWLSENEAKALYALGRWLAGPFLEVGAWCGKSTCCIAQGIRDGGRDARFISCELNPTADNFRIEGDEVRFYLPASSATPLSKAPASSYRDEIEPVLRAPGGVLGVLRRNLRARGLDGLVEIVEGDFLRSPAIPYRFVFADTMHEPAEIERNAPGLRARLAPGSHLACHDSDDVNERAIRDCFPIVEACTVDSLFIGRLGDA